MSDRRTDGRTDRFALTSDHLISSSRAARSHVLRNITNVEHRFRIIWPRSGQFLTTRTSFCSVNYGFKAGCAVSRHRHGEFMIAGPRKIRCKPKRYVKTWDVPFRGHNLESKYCKIKKKRQKLVQQQLDRRKSDMRFRWLACGSNHNLHTRAVAHARAHTMPYHASTRSPRTHARRTIECASPRRWCGGLWPGWTWSWAQSHKPKMLLPPPTQVTSHASVTLSTTSTCGRALTTRRCTG